MRREVRAQRRLDELLGRGIAAEYAQVLADVRARDDRDSSRSAAPLKPAEDAVVIDTTDLSIDEAVARATDIVAARR